MFKRRKLTKSFVFTDLNLQSQLTYDAIAKLCSPSCLHLVWNSLYLMEERDKQLSYVNRKLKKSFLEVKLNTAIKNTKLRSAPGIDQIDYNVISSLPCEHLNLLLKIYNSILSEGSFPNQWEQSLIVLIPKPDGSSFRSISLLLCFLKIMEKMIHNRIQWHIESHIIPVWIQTGQILYW